MSKSVQKHTNNDIKKMVDSFVHTASHLQSLLAKETDFLKVANRDGFLSLQDEKSKVALTYQKEIILIKDASQALKDKYPNLIPYLKEKQEGLSAVISENANALKSMERSTKRLGERIMDIARRVAVEQSSVSYGAAGAFDKNKRASMGLSESA